MENSEPSQRKKLVSEDRWVNEKLYDVQTNAILEAIQDLREEVKPLREQVATLADTVKRHENFIQVRIKIEYAVLTVLAVCGIFGISIVSAIKLNIF